MAFHHQHSHVNHRKVVRVSVIHLRVQRRVPQPLHIVSKSKIKTLVRWQRRKDDAILINPQSKPSFL